MDGETENRKKKLIQAVLNRDAALLNEGAAAGAAETENAEAAAEDKAKLFWMISTGAVKWQNFVELLAGVPNAARETAFAAITASRFKARILAYMSGVGFDNFEQLRVENIDDFLKRYPGPTEFEPAEADFLEAIRRSNPEQKYLDYKTEMDQLKRDIYGEKELYLETAQELMDEAEDWRLEQEAEKLEGPFLERAVISGDAWEQNGQNYALTTDLLKKVGLGPRYLLEMGGVQIALSRVFKVDSHDAAIGYIKFDENVRVRGFYRSNSQGMWRHLADYVGGNGEIAWYGTGFNEESLTLPMKIQKQLNEIAGRGIFEIPGVNTGFFLGGTAKRFASKDEYKQLVADGRMEADYYKEVNREPKLDFGVLSTLKHPPEGIDLTGDNEPNFRNQLDKFVMKTDMYGDVTVRQFPSASDELRFIVCEVGKGVAKKVWIAGIEVNSPITSTGLKKEWVSTGDICTPLFEYQTMTGGYGEAEGRTDGYESMWEKYLSQMPIVKKYLYSWRDSD